MLLNTWLPPTQHVLRGNPPIVRSEQAQSPLDLGPAPAGFRAVDSSDGSIAYSGPSLVHSRLVNSGIQLIGLRHGQAQSNAESQSLGQPLLYGQSESPLTEKGRRQAEECALKLMAQLGGDDWLREAIQDPKKLPVLVSSDLSRAKETAAILKAGLAQRAEELGGPEARKVVEQNVTTEGDARLRETNFGRFERRPLADLEKAYPEFVSNWRPSSGVGTDYLHRFPGGESRGDVMKRMGNFLDGCCLRFSGRTVIMISHGETLLSTRALLGQASTAAGKVSAETGAIPNATPVWFVGNEKNQAARGWSHVPYDLE